MLDDPRAGTLGTAACKQLLWLSRVVPPRVHEANVRLHLNAWHTDRRYQIHKNTCCRFCRLAPEDRIEHFVYCPVVRSVFPPRWRTEQHIGRCFFLRWESEDDLILCSILVYGLYAYHCYARHHHQTSEVTESILKLAAGAAQHGRASQIWERFTSPWRRARR